MSLPEDRVKTLVKTWRQKSHQEGDQFSSVVFIWFCFNAWLEHSSNKQTDRQMLDELKTKSPNMASLVEAYDTARSSDPLFMQGVRALRGMSREDPIQDVRGRHKPVTITDDEDFPNLLEALYRIRCNLFHGGKDANDARDQVLVKNAALVLKQWIGELIKGWD